MKFQEHFNNGLKSFKKGDFLTAILNFEECLNYDPNDFLVHYYLGLVHIYRKNYDTAFKFIKTAYQLNNEDVNVINALAFLSLKNGNTQEAINFWVEALEIEPKNIIIKKNLEHLKKSKDIKKLIESASPEEFIRFKIRHELKININKLLPTKKFVYIGSISLVSLALITIFVNIFKQKKPEKQNSEIFITQKENIPYSIEEIFLPDNEEDYIQRDIEKALFKYTKSDVKYLFSQCKKYLKEKRYNSAIIIINKVMHSNLSYIVKQKFALLKFFITPPSKFEIKDNILYSDIINFPSIYEGTYILWTGIVNDIKIDETKTQFRFIVKEDEGSIGITEVYFEKILPSLQNNDRIKLLGVFEKIKQGSRLPLIKGIEFMLEK